MESGPEHRGGWDISWTLSLARNSLVAAAVWSGALSWWRVMSDFGHRVRTACSTYGRHCCTYQSAVTVRLSSSGMVVICPVWAMYEATICLLALLDGLNFRGGVSPGKSQTPCSSMLCHRVALSTKDQDTQVSSPLTMFHVEFARPLSYFSSMVNAPYPPSALQSADVPPTLHIACEHLADGVGSHSRQTCQF